jgi:hypothetical protein
MIKVPTKNSILKKLELGEKLFVTFYRFDKTMMRTNHEHLSNNDNAIKKYLKGSNLREKAKVMKWSFQQKPTNRSLYKNKPISSSQDKLLYSQVGS